MRDITSVMLFLVVTGFHLAAQPAKVELDKLDYAPGETVNIIGTGWHSNETVKLQVIHWPDEVVHTEMEVHDPWYVTADLDGNFNSTWLVTENELGAELLLTASGQTSGLTWEVFFTDKVNKAVVLTSNPNPSIYGDQITLTASIERQNKNSYPSGSIEFRINGS